VSLNLTKSHFSIPLILFIFIIALSSGCAISKSQNNQQSFLEGRVTNIIPRNISEIEILEIQTDDNQIYKFGTTGFTGFTPSHIKEHQVTGQSIKVYYERSGNALIALEITD
jgi:hypothetical protein